MSSLYTPWTTDGDTPAPWSVLDTDERVSVLDAQGGLIADCTNGFDGDEGWVMSAACGPLAHLIAAAPELLEALQKIPQRYLNDMDAHTPKASAFIRTAIAKATGEQP